MQGKGIVVKTSGNTATVRIRKSSACGHDCGECRVCNNPEIEVDILNPINAKAGDTVLIGEDTSRILLHAFLLYILPVVGAMLVYAVCYSAAFSALLSALAVAVWLAVWFAYMRYYSKNKVTKSCALEVIHEEN